MSLILPPGLIGLRRKSALDVSQVFSTDLYTGNGSTQTITNGLDMSGEGGLVWIKSRSGAYDNTLFDTGRGVNNKLSSNTTGAEIYSALYGQTFNANGFSLDTNFGDTNLSGQTYVSWSFRQAPKFFDVVTYTGDGATQRLINHSLGVQPGMIITKSLNVAGDWNTRHISAGIGGLKLNTTASKQDVFSIYTSEFTATQFTVWKTSAPYSAESSNENGETYVAYLFAQNDDLIDCGSYVGNGSATGPVVTCGSGWTPQWLLVKRTDSTGDWVLYDSARDATNPRTAYLEPNTSDAEATGRDVDFTSTGFQPKTTDTAINASGGVYVYATIRAAA